MSCSFLYQLKSSCEVNKTNPSPEPGQHGWLHISKFGAKEGTLVEYHIKKHLSITTCHANTHDVHATGAQSNQVPARQIM